MRVSQFLAAASVIAATTAQDLATVLSEQPSLSSLVKLLGLAENTTEFLASQQGATLFAPNNAAIASIVSKGGIFNIGEAEVDPGLIEQILRYHLYRGVVRSEDITEIPQFVHSYLNFSGIVLDGEISGNNLTGGQVLQVNLDEAGNPTVTAGLKRETNIVKTDIEYDNGIIHIIDDLLLIPQSVADTLIAGDFTALAGAATELDLVTTLDEAKDVTIFVPNNDAFQKIAAASKSLTRKDLVGILEYHVVPGTVGYSTTLSNTSLPTLNGENVEITITDNGAVLVNSARVINADLLVENGVMHVIDQVLNPETPNASPVLGPSPTSSLPTFLPFTAGISLNTTVYSELTPTTSRVAAGLVSETSTATGTGGTAVQTGAGVRNALPALAAAAVGAVAFIVQ